MARETIFEGQLQFLYDQVYGAYVSGISPAPFELVVGETYVISWDGEEHTRTAFAADSFSPGAVGLGNAAFIGGEADPDGLVFIIGYVPSENLAAILTISKDASHTVGVYKEVEAEANIILKDPQGNGREYPLRPMVEMETADGGTVLYSRGEVLETVPVTLDFSGGEYQHVVLPDGYLAKSAVIAKPENLVPENIPVGINIAGVDGARESGGGGNETALVEEKDVCFYDFDGTRLYSYTAEEIQELTVLPPLPMHEHLISEEWTHTLDEIKSYTADCGICDVGALYSTEGGKTRIYIKTSEEDGMKFTLKFTQSVAGLVSIDWGDGNTEISGSTTGSVISIAHSYAEKGRYVIAIEIGSGTYTHSSLGNGYQEQKMVERIDFGTNFPKMVFPGINIKEIVVGINGPKTGGPTQRTCLKCCIFPRNFTLGSGSFNQSYNMGKCVFPLDITFSSSVSYGLLSYTSVTRICLPPVTATTSGMFYFNYALEEVALPEGITKLVSSTFGTCQGLKMVIFPSTITTIESSAFDNTYIGIYDFSKAKTIPSIANSTSAIKCQSYTKILVPSALYSSWIKTTNWSALATYIVAV